MAPLPAKCALYQPVSWNHYMRHMRALYNFAIEQGLLEQFINPFQKTSLRESRKKKKTLTREQILASRKVLNQFIEREKCSVAIVRLYIRHGFG
ncbi:hypothetical protein OIU92_13535 [Escherichia coli]|nr:hypothetical protein [Escherichia coli]